MRADEELIERYTKLYEECDGISMLRATPILMRGLVMITADILKKLEERVVVLESEKNHGKSD